LIVKATSSFLKTLNKLINKGIIKRDDYEETVKRFKENCSHQSLNKHKINCKKGHNIISISIINNQSIKILANIKDCSYDISIFSWIGNHRRYERIIKNKRNCKDIILYDCEDIKKMKEL